VNKINSIKKQASITKTIKLLVLLDKEDNYKQNLLVLDKPYSKEGKKTIKKAIDGMIGSIREDLVDDGDEDGVKDYDNMISIVQNGGIAEFMDYEVWLETVPHVEYKPKKEKIYVLRMESYVNGDYLFETSEYKKKGDAIKALAKEREWVLTESVHYSDFGEKEIERMILMDLPEHFEIVDEKEFYSEDYWIEERVLK
jgi:hypothetical protein